MADVLIRGMEMPESCDKCSLFNECWCMALGIENWRKSYNKPEQGERLPDCPLVPLPEGHGRLVDTREVLEKADKAPWFDGDASELGFLLGSEVTTIIPAEGDGNNAGTMHEKIDFVSRDEVIDNLCESCFMRNCSHDCDAIKAIRRTKPADVRPVVRGKWEIADSYAGPGLINLRCSVCGAFGGTWKDNTIPSMLPKFCHDCGADMRKVKADG